MSVSYATFVLGTALASAPVTPEEPQSLISIVITAIISASVFAALVTGTVQYIINRRNSRITERKNTVDAESDLVARYKEAAAEERAQKESAVQTVRNLLQIAEEQVNSLKSTVTTLNNLIDTMTHAANAQQEIIEKLTSERDRSQAALSSALSQIEEQKEQLIRRQQQILELTYPKDQLDKLRNQMGEDTES